MSASEEPDIALTLVIPLRAKAAMALPDFYQALFLPELPESAGIGGSTS